MTIQDVRDLIAGGRLDKAILAMIEIAKAKNDTSMESDILMQSGRYNQNEKQYRQGTLETSTYNRTRNQINYALLDYLKEYTEQDAARVNLDFGTQADPPQLPSESTPANNNAGNDITTILFLTSNPSGTAILQLDKEQNRIYTKLQNSPNFNKFRVKSTKAVTLSEFQEYLLVDKPNIVHFSGHGDKTNREVIDMVSRGLQVTETQAVNKDDTGIILYDEDKRNPFFVGTSVIQRIFKSMVQRQQVPIQTVVFNACYSEAQAAAIASVVPNVIGTSWSVKDEAAIAFATGFYFGIAQGENVADAFDLGINQALGYGEPEDRFVLYQNGQKVTL